MIARQLLRSLGSAAVLAASGMAVSALSTSVIPSASAQCPDVQVVFARGTGEAPGVGPTGQAFVDALHQRVGGRSFDVYPVNYPASDQWDTGIDG
ncbi:cutinase family protein, partial [Mycobacterium colombiense]